VLRSRLKQDLDHALGLALLGSPNIIDVGAHFRIEAWPRRSPLHRVARLSLSGLTRAAEKAVDEHDGIGDVLLDLADA
jgi:hypothetical protein